jgi:uncharacterized membrane protein YraQ (UPF0718 family)
MNGVALDCPAVLLWGKQMNMKRAMLILALVTIAAAAIIVMANGMRCTPPCV